MSSEFVPTDEQRMLRDSVRRWVQQLDPVHPAPVDDTWTHFAEMGWLAAGLPESLGGLGGGATESAIVAEELGRGLVSAPFIEVATTAALVLSDLAPERVPAILSGSRRPILAHHEPESRHDPGWVGCSAAKVGHEWLLTGTKVGIVGADSADCLLVTAFVTGVGLTLFEIPADGARLERQTTVDDRSYGELYLDDTVAVPVGEAGAADRPVRRALDHALVVSSAEAIGTMERALEITASYLLARRQFGQSLVDFQVLRHRLADMLIQIEQARSMMIRSVAAIDRQAETSYALAVATKARVAQAAMYVGTQAVQLHGGIGLTDEYIIGHYFKRLLTFSHHQGTADLHVERFSRFPQAVIQGLLYPENISSEATSATAANRREDL